MTKAHFSTPELGVNWDRIEGIRKVHLSFISRRWPVFLIPFCVMAQDYKPYKGSVGATYNQLVSTVGNVPGNRYNVDLNFDYHKNDPHLMERKFTFNALLNDQNTSMFSLNEAYLNKRWTRSELVSGRQILDWSMVDAQWGFGKLNNRQNFNYFTPGQEGLVGGNFKHRYNNGVKLQIFGSFLYVPETNPSLDINNSKGTITSNNPWANPPSRTATIGNREIPIRYKVDYPSLNDIVFRYSIGASLAYETEHWKTNAFYMRKPENNISTTVQVSYDSSADIVRASIDPQVYYHDLYGGNLAYVNDGLTIYVSGIAIRPNDFPDGDLTAFEYTQIEMEKRREDFVGGGIVKEDDRLAYGFNYVARLSPFDREDDILAQDPRWNQAVNAFTRFQFTTKFSAKTDIKYDMLTTDRLVMVQGQYMATSQLAISGGVNMIGTPTNGKSYWSPYKNNDAIYAALRVLF
jgi:hypothetical protein